MSLRGSDPDPPDPMLHSAIRLATLHNILVVAPTGMIPVSNSNQIDYPEVVTVAAAALLIQQIEREKGESPWYVRFGMSCIGIQSRMDPIRKHSISHRRGGSGTRMFKTYYL
jgi:hypothetical protein